MSENITAYLLDQHGVHVETAYLDAHARMPERFSLVVPPQLEVGQVAQWTGVAWNVLDEPPGEVVALPPVPQEVTMRQARLALLGIGKLDQVAPAIETLTGADRDCARIEWEFSSTVVRSRPLVVMLGHALGLDEAALDQLFITAAGL